MAEPHQATRVQFRVAGNDVPVDRAAAARVIDCVERIVRSSNWNSLHDPKMFEGSTEYPSDTNFIRIAYSHPKDLKTHRGVVTAKSIDVVLDKTNLPGPYLIRAPDGQLVRFTLWYGGYDVELAKIPGVREHLPARIRATVARDYAAP